MDFRIYASLKGDFQNVSAFKSVKLLKVSSIINLPRESAVVSEGLNFDSPYRFHNNLFNPCMLGKYLNHISQNQRIHTRGNTRVTCFE